MAVSAWLRRSPRRAVALLVLLVAAAVFGVPCLTRAVFVFSHPVPARFRGVPLRLYALGPARVALASDAEASHAFAASFTSSGLYGAGQRRESLFYTRPATADALVYSGRIRFVADGTAAVAICASDYGGYLVRLTSGDLAGEQGWVNGMYVVRADEARFADTPPPTESNPAPPEPTSLPPPPAPGVAPGFAPARPAGH